MRHYQTIQVIENHQIARIALNRPEKSNALNCTMLKELLQAISQIESDSKCAAIVIESQGKHFSAGMDLFEAYQNIDDESKLSAWAIHYFALLKKFLVCSKIIVIKTQGVVFGGSIGLLAAADHVIATSQSKFRLPELTIGLLPALVAPFLMRRIGYRQSYQMGLFSKEISAEHALQIGLIDEIADIAGVDLSDLVKLKKNDAIYRYKCYFNALQPIDRQTEQLAIQQFVEMFKDPVVREHLQNSPYAKGADE